jgi:hypothetical protein
MSAGTATAPVAPDAVAVGTGVAVAAPAAAAKAADICTNCTRHRAPRTVRLSPQLAAQG